MEIERWKQETQSLNKSYKIMVKTELEIKLGFFYFYLDYLTMM